MPKSSLPKSSTRTVRIIGGQWKRTRLPVLDAEGLRPTPDRVRETLFNWIGPRIAGSSVLDLFAGTGALSFEAASRGAASVVCVESNRAAAAAIRVSIDKLRATTIEVQGGDAFRFAEQSQRLGRRFDLIFLDPPFRLDLAETALAAAAPCLAPHGLIYLEAEKQVSSATLDVLGLSLHRSDSAGQVHYHLLSSAGI
ncbi:16S rRNA (guanine(966)-N(2))-methyltransferase RsmD [soil metagenome]